MSEEYTTINYMLEPIVWAVKSPLASATVAYIRAFQKFYRVTDTAGREIGRVATIEEAEQDANAYMSVLFRWTHQRAAKRIKSGRAPSPNELRKFATTPEAPAAE